VQLLKEQITKVRKMNENTINYRSLLTYNKMYDDLSKFQQKEIIAKEKRLDKYCPF